MSSDALPAKASSKCFPRKLLEPSGLQPEGASFVLHRCASFMQPQQNPWCIIDLAYICVSLASMALVVLT